MTNIIYSKITIDQVEKIKDLFSSYNDKGQKKPSLSLKEKPNNNTKNKLIKIFYYIDSVIETMLFMIITFMLFDLKIKQFISGGYWILLILWGISFIIEIALLEKIHNNFYAPQPTQLSSNTHISYDYLIKSDYFYSFENMLLLENKLKDINLKNISYISKGINRGENQYKSLFNINIMIWDKDQQNVSAKDFFPVYGEYLTTSINNTEEVFKLPIIGIVECNNGILNFSPLDEQFVLITKVMLYSISNTDITKVDELTQKAKDILGEEIFNLIPDYNMDKKDIVHVNYNIYREEQEE